MCLILPLMLRRSTVAPVDQMPEPGDLIAAFSSQPGRCFRMVQSVQLQATRCYEPPAWKGVWRGRTGKSWYVEACPEHAPKVSAAPSECFKADEPATTGDYPRCPSSSTISRWMS